MDFAIGGNKNPGATWQQVQMARRKKRQNSVKSKKLKTKKQWNPDVSGLLKTAADTFARGVLFLAFCYGGVHAYLFVTSSQHFAISDVSFEGNKVIRKAELLRWAPALMNQNLLLLDLEKTTERLNKHPWVYSVGVQKKWPNALSVQLRERQPYARIQLGQKEYVMDHYGILLQNSTEQYETLPLITGVEKTGSKPGDQVHADGILEGLKAMHYFNRMPFFEEDPLFRLQVAESGRLTFSTHQRNLQVMMSSESVSHGFQNFKIILEALEPEKTEIEYIDLSFRDKVVIKPVKGKSGIKTIHQT